MCIVCMSWPHVYACVYLLSYSPARDTGPGRFAFPLPLVVTFNSCAFTTVSARAHVYCKGQNQNEREVQEERNKWYDILTENAEGEQEAQ